MSEDKAKLSHVLWIGGATDAGKTTVARILAEQHALPVYHYDRHDLPHHVRLAESEPVYRHFLDASLEERWVIPDPPALLRRSLRSFQDRFPLVIEDLLGVASGGPVIAEGFGLLPALVAPLLSTPRQAIWLVPTEAFKRTSMQRRNKPSFAAETSDPQRATDNLFHRDVLLAEFIRAQVQEYGLTLLEVDGSRDTGEVAGAVEHHFAPHPAGIGRDSEETSDFLEKSDV